MILSSARLWSGPRKGCLSERIYPVGRLDRNTTRCVLLFDQRWWLGFCLLILSSWRRRFITFISMNLTAHDMIRSVRVSPWKMVRSSRCCRACRWSRQGTRLASEIHSSRRTVSCAVSSRASAIVLPSLDHCSAAGLTKKNLRRGWPALPLQRRRGRHAPYGCFGIRKIIWGVERELISRGYGRDRLVLWQLSSQPTSLAPLNYINNGKN